MFVTRAMLVRHNTGRANPDTFARLYPDGVNVTRGLCLHHAARFTWGDSARGLLRPDIAQEYAEALALAAADYAATLAESCGGSSLNETEALLFADRAYRKALAPARQEYSRAWALTWFDHVLPALIERSQTK
jgi:hypothetical protein